MDNRLVARQDGRTVTLRDAMTAKSENDEETAATNRNQRRRQRTRQTILAAADRVFRRKGIDGATVNDITEEADVAYGSFYNHFKSIDEIVSALAGESFQRVAAWTGAILQNADRVELLPCIGARVVLRTLSQDPAIRWLLHRPYVLIEEFRKIALPFMLGAEHEAVESGRLRPAGGHACWLRTYPWILIAELNSLLTDGDIIDHEDNFAYVSLRFLGVSDELAPELIERSRILVAENGLPEPRKPAKPGCDRAAKHRPAEAKPSRDGL